MSRNIRATVRDEADVRVRSNISVSRRLEEFTNIDSTNLENGSLLVYKTNTNRWTSTRQLDEQNIDCGEF